jgi:hypothetical protein
VPKGAASLLVVGRIRGGDGGALVASLAALCPGVDESDEKWVQKPFGSTYCSRATVAVPAAKSNGRGKRRLNMASALHAVWRPRKMKGRRRSGMEKAYDRLRPLFRPHPFSVPQGTSKI